MKQIQLEMHPEHQRDLAPRRIDEQRVVPVELASILDLETVFVGGPPALTVLVRSECVAHEVESLSGRSSDRELERSRPRVRVRDNARATLDKRVLDALGD